MRRLCSTEAPREWKYFDETEGKEKNKQRGKEAKNTTGIRSVS